MGRCKLNFNIFLMCFDNLRVNILFCGTIKQKSFEGRKANENGIVKTLWCYGCIGSNGNKHECQRNVCPDYVSAAYTRRSQESAPLLMDLVKRLTSIMADQGIIEREEQVVYDYGVRQGFWLLVNLVTAILFGLWLCMLPQCLIFLWAYMVLRTFAGGYHARTPILCYMEGSLVIIAALLMIKHGIWLWNTLIAGVFLILAGSIVMILAPVEDKNKPLDNLERVVYGRRAKIIVVIEIGVVIVARVLGLQIISSSITVAVYLMAIILIVGNIRK